MYEYFENNLDRSDYVPESGSDTYNDSVDSLLNKNNLTNVGCLNPKFTKSKHFFTMNLPGKSITLEQAIEKMNRMNMAEDDIYDVLIYNRHGETGYVGELHLDFIKEDLTDFNDVSQPQSKHFSNVFLQKKDCIKNNSYNVYIKKW